MKSHSAKLESENKKMEERLQILKQMMSVEKARRELDGGLRWESGKPGPLRPSIKNVSPPYFTTSRKVHAKSKPKKPTNVTLISKNNSAELEPGEKLVLLCGQCERSSATLICVECIENYCQLCFAKMHQKGGLAKHRVKPILRKVKPILAKSMAGVGDATVRKASVAEFPTVERIGEDGSLLDGTYNEASSAQSFQDAWTEWHSGNTAVSYKQCNTSSEDASTEPVAKLRTTAGAMQADESSSIQQELQNSITFPDTNRVTYFEKLLIRRHKESTLYPRGNRLLNGRALVEPQEDRAEEMEDKEEGVANTISEYNIFYDDEDVLLAYTDPMDDTSFDDFNGTRPCIGLVIGDMLINGDKMESCESNIHKDKGDLGQQIQSLKKPVSSSMSKEKDTLRQKHRGKKKRNEVKVRCSKTKITSTDSYMTHDATCATHQLSQSDLVTSVQSARLSCTQGNAHNQLLTSFFLHAVRPANSSKENPEKPSQLLSETTASGSTMFTLGCSTWVPNSSIAQGNQLCDKVKDASHAPDHTPRECRDACYDDSTSDSEQENEQELFLSSRPGTVHKSMGSDRDSRVAGFYEDLEREEEEMERDKADCDALESLACELHVSSVLDGWLTATSQREQQELDEKEEGEKMEEGLLEEDVGGVDTITSWTSSRELLD